MKYKRLNTILLTLVLILTNSCNQKKNDKEIVLLSNYSITAKDSIKIKDVYNKIFYNITQTDSIDIIYHYCDANVNTIKVYKDSIWEDFGQESYTMNYSVSKVLNNKTILMSNPNQIDFTFELLDIQKGYWKINNKIYIDSLKIDAIIQYEQPCLECWDEDDCIEMERQKKLRLKVH